MEASAAAATSDSAAAARSAQQGAAASPSARPQPDAATGQASPHLQPGPALVQQCWHTAFDYNSQRWYFYNTATLERRWDPPPGWVPPASAAPAAVPPVPLLHPAHALAAAAAAHAAAAHHLALASQSGQKAAASAAPSSSSSAATAAGSGAAAPSPPAAAGSKPAAGQPAGGGAAGVAPRPPSSTGRAAAAQEAAAAQYTAAAAAGAATIPLVPGYFYLDSYGCAQGPFSKEHLQAWRGQLPLDLPVYHRQEAPQQPGEEPGVGVGPATWQELAKLLGDGELLARWRGDNPDKAGVPGSAPTAEAFEEELAAGGGYTAYAAAALAGLPADDDAVHIARVAAHAGKSIQEVLAFNYGSGGSGALGDYTMTALHCRGRGRVQVADGQGEGLYDEMGSWVDASTVEEQLARAAEARRRALSGKELAALKARKVEMKKRKQLDWLTR